MHAIKSKYIFEYTYNTILEMLSDQDIYMNKFPFTSPQKENLHDKMLKPSANLDQPKPKLDMNLDVKLVFK